ncbi:SDR family oxidoreductase [Bowmanella sp. Y26]|uniref:SDR family NAD(P)-dependent oxidoreductase n=1 Tax=Bowmanella yangjiangensis TaxID=2811230 RepID=UPI001BDCA535|nr:SDR family oxidoreductase [Bowmanella yangjiangensis]MBT1064122.1 SDR family oxidoreductase [Bowmanella yangjiangensis]
MQINLTNKTAFISGSTLGIGFAIAQGLLACGATVVINGRKPQAVTEAIAKLREEFPQPTIRGVAADLATAEGCQTLLAQEPHADILINNLGIYGLMDFFATPDEEWQRFFDVNVLSGIRLSRAYVPGMLSRNWGRVIFISSESGLQIPADMIHYGMTKTANLAVSRGLAKRVAGSGVTVNAVLPGPTLSEGVETFFREGAKQAGQCLEEFGTNFVREHRPTSIIQRPATVAEVASMVTYLASPQASATTGAALRVDGGVVDSIS